MTTNIYLETQRPVIDQKKVHISVESYVCLFVHKYVSNEDITIHLVHSDSEDLSKPGIVADLSSFNVNILSASDYSSTLANLCNFPVLVNGTNVVVAGLCGVTRGIVKASAGNQELLGFKNGCLQAPAETSVWTKFCELDVIQATQLIVQFTNDNQNVDSIFQLPPEFGRFEQHLKQPVRVHNIYKIARNQAQDRLKQSLELSRPNFANDGVQDVSDKLSEMKLEGKSLPKKLKQAAQIKSSIPMADLDIAHTFAEGQHLTLADLILFSCFSLVSDIFPELHLTTLEKELPQTNRWLKAVENAIFSKIHCFHTLKRSESMCTFQVDMSDTRSLYKNDSKRYRPRGQIYTKQSDIEASLSKVDAINLDICSDKPRFTDSDFSWWSTLPFDALPEGGDLPPDRLLRKQHQLQCLAVEVLRIARPGDRIVDFCSGAGHLGILIATLRPDCRIFLLENKEESLMRAKHRVERLGLRNVSFFQCNLDYFRGHFDVGTSLHACGVATDIVLQHCMSHRAAFVCCPCCYGGIRPMSHIAYPRSRLFSDALGMRTQDCLHVGHCADQAHDVRKGPCNEAKAAQGQRCMDVVDWDRKVCAEEAGYDVVLTRLQPEECTPKNRLLIGELFVERH